jgi:hypothetical protein
MRLLKGMSLNQIEERVKQLEHPLMKVLFNLLCLKLAQLVEKIATGFYFQETITLDVREMAHPDVPKHSLTVWKDMPLECIVVLIETADRKALYMDRHGRLFQKGTWRPSVNGGLDLDCGAAWDYPYMDVLNGLNPLNGRIFAMRMNSDLRKQSGDEQLAFEMNSVLDISFN